MIDFFTTLEDTVAKLIPLEASHFDLLWPIAQQLDLHEFGPSNISTPEKLKEYIQEALSQREEGTSIPFAIIDKRNNTLAGCTRMGRVSAFHKSLEIGWTWIGPDYQGSGLNTHVKHLMLNHIFKVMDFEKVNFRIDERNIRSRKAVEKLGAQLEGLIRSEVIVKGGFRRSSACYGILKEEWLKKNPQS